MATNTNSPSEDKQPLSERSSNLPSPIKSPSKIALPPSPVTSPFKNKLQARDAKLNQQETIGTKPQNLKDHALPDFAPPKPALIRKFSEAHSSGQAYISPSDDILSPTTKKLTEVKGRRFAGSKKNVLYNASTLFAKPASRRSDENGNGIS